MQYLTEITIWIWLGLNLESRTVNTMETMLDIMTRLSNRYFVGLPLCRNTEYLELAKEYSKDIAIAGFLIRIWPDWMKPIASRFSSSIPKHQRMAMKYLGPMIHTRRDKHDLLGKKWKDKPVRDIFWPWNGLCFITSWTCLTLLCSTGWLPSVAHRRIDEVLWWRECSLQRSRYHAPSDVSQLCW